MCSLHCVYIMFISSCVILAWGTSACILNGGMPPFINDIMCSSSAKSSVFFYNNGFSVNTFKPDRIFWSVLCLFFLQCIHNLFTLPAPSILDVLSIMYEYFKTGLDHPDHGLTEVTVPLAHLVSGPNYYYYCWLWYFLFWCILGFSSLRMTISHTLALNAWDY